jgi:hypothetical protein
VFNAKLIEENVQAAADLRAQSRGAATLAAWQPVGLSFHESSLRPSLIQIARRNLV